MSGEGQVVAAPGRRGRREVSQAALLMLFGVVFVVSIAGFWILYGATSQDPMALHSLTSMLPVACIFGLVLMSVMAMVFSADAGPVIVVFSGLYSGWWVVQNILR